MLTNPVTSLLRPFILPTQKIAGGAKMPGCQPDLESVTPLLRWAYQGLEPDVRRTADTTLDVWKKYSPLGSFDRHAKFAEWLTLQKGTPVRLRQKAREYTAQFATLNNVLADKVPNLVDLRLAHVPTTSLHGQMPNAAGKFPFVDDDRNLLYQVGGFFFAMGFSTATARDEFFKNGIMNYLPQEAKDQTVSGIHFGVPGWREAGELDGVHYALITPEAFAYLVQNNPPPQ